MQHEMQKHAHLLRGVLTPTERKIVTYFIQAPEDSLGATPTFKQAYAPQSGEIFGILKQMKETFESNLSESQKEELARQTAFKGLKAAKEQEISAGQKQIAAKQQELSETDLSNVEAKQDIKDTKASLTADEQFLMMLKEKCQMTDQEWEKRQKTRQEEMGAVSEAIAILSTDDAHDLFTRTFNPPSFLQRKVSLEKRGKASKLLLSVAHKLHNPKLAVFATRVKLDAFTKVKKAIDDMVTQLLKEKDDEIKHKDFCTDEFNTNELQRQQKDQERAELSERLEYLKSTIHELKAAIDEEKAENAEMNTQIKRAGEDREKEKQISRRLWLTSK